MKNFISYRYELLHRSPYESCIIIYKLNKKPFFQVHSQKMNPEYPAYRTWLKKRSHQKKLEISMKKKV